MRALAPRRWAAASDRLCQRFGGRTLRSFGVAETQDVGDQSGHLILGQLRVRHFACRCHLGVGGGEEISQRAGCCGGPIRDGLKARPRLAQNGGAFLIGSDHVTGGANQQRERVSALYGFDVPGTCAWAPAASSQRTATVARAGVIRRLCLGISNPMARFCPRCESAEMAFGLMVRP